MLARALLRGARLLVLDEATSSVDFELRPPTLPLPPLPSPFLLACADLCPSLPARRTDELITRALAQTFASSTLLVIAHRLRTVVRFDRVLVLSQGRVVEFGPSPLTALPPGRRSLACATR